MKLVAPKITQLQLKRKASSVAKDRVPIDKDLAAEVMFASDRTCCICRQSKNVQIHHIDENPSNNARENLAIVCQNCHSEVHTIKSFARGTTPDVVRLYDSYWRDIIKLRLMPAAASPEYRELALEAYLEASLDCHRWKNWFMSLAGPNLPGGNPGEFTDVWDLLAERWVPEYAEATYQRFLPLFNEGIREVQGRFDRLFALFPDVLPFDFRTLLIRANRQLEGERFVYGHLPMIFSGGVIPDDGVGGFFGYRFVSVAHVLRDVSRDADRRRKSLVVG